MYVCECVCVCVCEYAQEHGLIIHDEFFMRTCMYIRDTLRSHSLYGGIHNLYMTGIP